MWFLRASTTIHNTSKNIVSKDKHYITLVKQVVKVLGSVWQVQRSAVFYKNGYFTWKNRFLCYFLKKKLWYVPFCPSMSLVFLQLTPLGHAKNHTQPSYIDLEVFCPCSQVKKHQMWKNDIFCPTYIHHQALHTHIIWNHNLLTCLIKLLRGFYLKISWENSVNTFIQ